jgi:hypothetical protein
MELSTNEVMEAAAQKRKIERLQKCVSNFPEIQANIDAQREAVEAAASVVDSKDEAVRELTGLLRRLGRDRYALSKVQSLALSEEREKEVAQIALDYYVANITADSIETRTGYRNSIEFLAFFKALTPYVAPFIAAENAKIAASVVRIKAMADAESIDIAKLMTLIQSEADPHFASWVQQGFYSDIVSVVLAV